MTLWDQILCWQATETPILMGLSEKGGRPCPRPEPGTKGTTGSQVVRGRGEVSSTTRVPELWKDLKVHPGGRRHRRPPETLPGFPRHKLATKTSDLQRQQAKQSSRLTPWSLLSLAFVHEFHPEKSQRGKEMIFVWIIHILPGKFWQFYERAFPPSFSVLLAPGGNLSSLWLKNYPCTSLSVTTWVLGDPSRGRCENADPNMDDSACMGTGTGIWGQDHPHWDVY